MHDSMYLKCLNSKTHRNRKYNTGCQGLQAGKMELSNAFKASVMLDGKFLDLLLQLE